MGWAFPMRVGASTVLLEKAGPDELLPAIMQHRATICFTAPTAYRAMLSKIEGYDISSLRKCVSAGEPLPKGTFEAWKAAHRKAYDILKAGPGIGNGRVKIFTRALQRSNGLAQILRRRLALFVDQLGGAVGEQPNPLSGDPGVARGDPGIGDSVGEVGCTLG